MLRANQSSTVVTVLVEMQLVRNTVLMQSGSVELRVLYGHQLVFHRMPEETRWQAGL